jgi:hypothetical protein
MRMERLMATNSSLRPVGRWLLALTALGTAAYAAYVGATWYRYGKPRRRGRNEDLDPGLERFLPEYEVSERHQVRVAAPVAMTFEAACAMDLNRSRTVRAIFRVREWILGGAKNERREPRGIVEEMKSVGWGVLEEVPGRAIVLGAVTQPWIADTVFRALAPEEFRSFREPGYVKIAVTFRADPAGDDGSIFRTETRVATTDETARKKFRRYWSFLSPGILWIRWVSLGVVKGDAERRARSSSRRTELEAAL